MSLKPSHSINNYVVKSLFIGFLLLFCSGCLPKQDDFKRVLQTNSATTIKKDKDKIQKSLIELKKKLDKRNPSAFSKQYEARIYKLLRQMDGTFLLKYKNNILENYKDYLQLAFSKDEVYNRNDYLILGIYYLFHYAYKLDSSHKVTALEYDKDKLEKFYKNLQIIKWKIKVDKDLKDNYLFLTWQNNWQIELEKRLKSGEKLSFEQMQKLKFIQENKENILDSSNFSFEVLLSKMIESTRNSLEVLGEEPQELTVKAMFLFL